MVELLNARLADAVTLALFMKQAHWNIRGLHFLPLHELFDDVVDHAREWGDLIAERAGALGGLVDGTPATAADRTTLPDYPADVTDGDAHVTHVARAIAAFAEGARAGIEAAAEAGDAVTEDVLTEVAREADQDLWFVEAHLQG
jgi:starvation-inducible DNA-binding protein